MKKIKKTPVSLRIEEVNYLEAAEKFAGAQSRYWFDTMNAFDDLETLDYGVIRAQYVGLLVLKEKAEKLYWAITNLDIEKCPYYECMEELEEDRAIWNQFIEANPFKTSVINKLEDEAQEMYDFENSDPYVEWGIDYQNSLI